MTTVVKGRRRPRPTPLRIGSRTLVTGAGGRRRPDAAPSPPLDRLAPLGGVSRFPMRVKCATLAWHALHAALDATRPTVRRRSGPLGANCEMGSPSEFMPVAAVADLPPRQLLSVRTPGGDQVVIMNVGGEIFALRDQCSHERLALSAGELLDDGTIECVWHGARFDCRTGAVLDLPAVEDVQAFAVRVENGQILDRPSAPAP